VSEIVFVGTSDAFGAGGRRQSAILLRGGPGTTLIDCGATTASGLEQLGISRNEIDTILISHFHGDHFGGIPLLLLAGLYEDERKHPLRIAGPPGIEERVRQLAVAMGYPLDKHHWPFDVLYDELPVGRELEIGPARVRSFETRHSPDSCPHGLLIQSGKDRIAYSGDTGWFEELPREVAGASLFICECTYHSFDFEFHLNHAQLVEHRDEFDCGRIVLTHLGAEMVDKRGAASFDTADDGLILGL
jgi:ribonuclease BN (tRNA processing enzyme)